MQGYEYYTIPAPQKAPKVRGLKTPADRYAHALTQLMNDMAAEGWEYWRADTLYSQERKGLTGTRRVEHYLLIFRRPTADALADQMAGHGQELAGHEADAQPAGQDAPQPDQPARAEPRIGPVDGSYQDTGPRLTALNRE